jgi:hypothetical protein
MREISDIAAQLRAVRNAREHFMALWALESAYDLPIKADAVRQDLQRLAILNKRQLRGSFPRGFQDD